MKKLLRITEAADLLKCHPETLRRLDRKGLIKSQRNYLGHRVFKHSDIIQLKQKREALR
jgi:DNA-binding transcriptional MerR regulator